eukprot:4543304-Amphidinium_carterae.2
MLQGVPTVFAAKFLHTVVSGPIYYFKIVTFALYYIFGHMTQEAAAAQSASAGTEGQCSAQSKGCCGRAIEAITLGCITSLKSCSKASFQCAFIV